MASNTLNPSPRRFLSLLLPKNLPCYHLRIQGPGLAAPCACGITITLDVIWQRSIHPVALWQHPSPPPLPLPFFCPQENPVVRLTPPSSHVTSPSPIACSLSVGPPLGSHSSWAEESPTGLTSTTCVLSVGPPLGSHSGKARSLQWVLRPPPTRSVDHPVALWQHQNP